MIGLGGELVELCALDAHDPAVGCEPQNAVGILDHPGDRSAANEPVLVTERQLGVDVEPAGPGLRADPDAAKSILRDPVDPAGGEARRQLDGPKPVPLDPGDSPGVESEPDPAARVGERRRRSLSHLSKRVVHDRGTRPGEAHEPRAREDPQVAVMIGCHRPDVLRTEIGWQRGRRESITDQAREAGCRDDPQAARLLHVNRPDDQAGQAVVGRIPPDPPVRDLGQPVVGANPYGAVLSGCHGVYRRVIELRPHLNG